MKVTQEKLPASQIALEIEIPAETSKQAYEKVVNNLSRTINLPGFRKGKVPRQILLQRLGPERIRAEVLDSLIQEGIQAAIKQEEIEALGNYQLVSDIEELVKGYKPGEAFTFSASVDVPPEIKLGDYTSLSIKAEKTEYDPARVDEFLEQQRAKQATLVPVEGRPAQAGDIVVVDYQGRIPGAGEAEDTLIEGGEAMDFEIELAPGKFVDDLLKGIEGMTLGETKEIPVRFPDQYAREDLAGVLSTFTVTLKELKEKELPELDDDLAEEISEFETMAELREHLEQQYQEEAEQETEASVEQYLAEALLEVTEIELPKTLVDQEVDALLQQTAMRMQQFGVDLNILFNKENIPHLRENSRPEAIKRLKTALALAELAKQESLEPEVEELEKRVSEVAEQLKDREIDRDRLRSFITDELRQDKAIAWLKERATIEFVPKGTLSQADEDSESEDEAVEVEVVKETTEEE